MGKERIIKLLLEEFPKTYSEELGINLKSRKSGEIFKWFLASILFGARISETIAKNTYKTLEKYKLLTPKKILEAGWSFLVNPVMREGGYIRYDGKTSTMLLDISEKLLKEYKTLTNLYKTSKDQKELEDRLKSFKGVGPVTIQIFLRELRDIWKVDPELSRFTILAAKNLSLIKSENPEKALKNLKEVWEKI